MNRLAGSVAGRWAAAGWGLFALGVGGGFVVAPAAALLSVLAVLAAGASALALALAAARKHRAALLAAVILAGLLGAVRGAAASQQPGPGRIDGHLGVRSVAVVGTVRESIPGGGAEVVVDAQRVSDADSDSGVSGGLLVVGSNLPAVAPGDRVEVDAAGLKAPGRRPGPESEAALERQDIEAIAVAPLMSILEEGAVSPARLVAAAQAHLVAAVNGVLPEPAAALLLGVAFGIRQPLASEVRAPLQDAGLIHIVVVSGLKVVMLLGLIGAAARSLAWSRRRTLLLAILLVGAYVLLSGAGPAAVRSALMAGAALLARTGARRTDPLPMLALVAALMLGVDPRLVVDSGFQLSFLGTAGIVLLAAPLVRRTPGPRWLAEPFAVTVAAQLATVPVMAGTFGVIALDGPIANALVLPLLPALILVGGGGAILASVVPALGWLPLQAAGLVTGAVVMMARLLSAIPGAAIPIGTWPVAWTIAELAALVSAGAVLWVAHALRAHRSAERTMNQRAESPGTHIAKRWFAVAAVAAVVAPIAAVTIILRPDGRLHVTVLDTGAAPAVMVETGDGATALIDGGASPSVLLQALGRVLPATTRRIDLVVVTGGEKAAIAGLAALPGHYDVGVVMATHDLNPGGVAVVNGLEQAGAIVVDPAGRAWRWGGAIWRCLGFQAASTARAMCALIVSDSSGRLLALGDAGTADQEEICALYAPALSADVVVTPPGGALSSALVAIARPSMVAIPSAKGAAAALAYAGVAVDRTGNDGDLRFVGGPGGLTEAR